MSAKNPAQIIADTRPCETAPNGTGSKCTCVYDCTNYYLRAAGYDGIRQPLLTATYERRTTEAGPASEARRTSDRGQATTPSSAMSEGPSAPASTTEKGLVIKAAFFQKIVWGLILGVAFAAMVAGVYAIITQIDWRVGGTQLFYFKPRWDHLFSYASWDRYRHNERDMMEPAMATLGLMTIMARQKYWGKRVATWRLFATPPLLAAVAIGLVAALTWVEYFGLTRISWLDWLTGWPRYPLAASLVFGFVVGRVCHLLWAPVGAHLQGEGIGHSVAKWQGRKLRSPHWHPLPLWVRFPIAPPPLRQRWWAMHTEVQPAPGRLGWAFGTAITLGVLTMLIGLLFHFGIGVAGLHVPYFSPPT